MAKVEVDGPEPAAMDDGVKVAVVPVGNPLTESETGLTKVALDGASASA